MVADLRLAGGRGNGFRHRPDQRLGPRVETDHGTLRIRRSLGDIQRVLPVTHELGAGVGRNDPLLAKPRLEFVFLSVRRTVSSLIAGTIWSSTRLSASNGNVHFARPSGAWPQATALNRASPAPSSVRGLLPERGRGAKPDQRHRPSTASAPATTDLWPPEDSPIRPPTPLVPKTTTAQRPWHPYPCLGSCLRFKPQPQFIPQKTKTNKRKLVDH